MQKTMKVTLTTSIPATATSGSFFEKRDWEIPFESLDEEAKATQLEQEMKSVVSNAFHIEHQGTLNHLMYNDLSAGGELKVGNVTLTVRFEKFRSITHPLPAPAGA